MSSKNQVVKFNKRPNLIARIKASYDEAGSLDYPFKVPVNWLFVIFCVVFVVGFGFKINTYLTSDLQIESVYFDLFTFLLSVIGVYVSVVSFFVMLSLSRAQNESLDEIKSDQLREKNSNRFFQMDSQLGVVLVVPVVCKDRPLAMINSGDYYAILVITERMKGEVSYDWVRNHDGDPALSSGLQEEQLGDLEIQANLDNHPNHIYLCTPWVNRKLNNRWPIWNQETIYDGTDKSNYNFPCWFYRDVPKNAVSKKGKPYLKIRINWNNDIVDLESMADKYYDMAEIVKRCYSGKEYKLGPSVDDFAIIARLTHKDGRKDIIVAGLHQLGTWIVADFINGQINRKINRGKPYDCRDDEISEIILGSDDFIAIISGTFDFNIMKVTWSEVYHGHIWQYKQGSWIKYVK
ncbi:MAG: hypothetical protein H7834_03425 [Magnetococcus sp. YQC-9]